MKKIIVTLFLIILVIITIIFRKNITDYFVRNIVKREPNDILEKNKYYRENSYHYIKLTDNFKIENKKQLKNIFYTILNSGDDSFYFHCSEKYKGCKEDVKDFFNDKVTLAHINNFVHPFNSFKNIKVNITNYGKVTMNVTKIYNEDEISYVNNEIDYFINNNVNESMNTEEKIKIFHDYIVNNTKFDTDVNAETDRLNTISYTSYGLLFNHKAICGGYADAMAIYLDKLGIKNYKISTAEHVWNLINVDNKWLHLDATWDDPVTSNGSDMLIYDYYLIDTEKLKSLDTTQHTFDENIYLETK